MPAFNPTLYTRPMSELQAVNLILAVIDEAEVSSLVGAESNANSAKAYQMLLETSREVQSEGWWFNTELEYTLDPGEDGHIVLPANHLKVDTVYTSARIDAVVRGGKLYDRANHTYAIGEAVKVDMVVGLAFSDIPQSARWYITVKAARRFAESETGSGPSLQDELNARAALEGENGENDDRSLAHTNPHIAAMRRRYRR